MTANVVGRVYVEPTGLMMANIVRTQQSFCIRGTNLLQACVRLSAYGLRHLRRQVVHTLDDMGLVIVGDLHAARSASQTENPSADHIYIVHF